MRLDRRVAELANISRSAVRRLLDASAVRLNGRIARPADAGRDVADSDVVTWDLAALRPGPPDASLPEPRILQRTGDAIVCDKPAGLPVHPLRPDETDTLLHRVARLDPAVFADMGEGPLRGGTVHRLDVGTSGCVVFARHPAAWRSLRDAFVTRAATKHYVAVVAGEPPPPGRLEAWLAVTRHRPARVGVVDAAARGARRCDLTVGAAVVEPASPGRWRLPIELGTGFLHQIRVMLAERGAPIVGDPLYGVPADDGVMRLHAAAIAIPAAGIDAACPPLW